MARLDTDRQKELEPQRMQYARKAIESLGYTIAFESETEIRFEFEGAIVKLYPYSGWHTGSTITDGRGIEKLLNQLKKQS